MTKKEFDSLEVGDVIRDKLLGLGYTVEVVVVRPYRKCIVRREMTATNPAEWDLVKKFGVKERAL
jgi:hypothetical protein